MSTPNPMHIEKGETPEEDAKAEEGNEEHEGAMSPYTLRFLGKDLEALYLRHSSGTRGALAVSTNPHPTPTPSHRRGRLQSPRPRGEGGRGFIV